MEVFATVLKWDAGRTKKVGGSNHRLKLVNDSCPVFTHFVLKHVVDESSPLYNQGQPINPADIWQVTVLARVYDTVYTKEARLFHAYSPEDLVQDAEFVDIVNMEPEGGYVIDHSVLSEYSSTAAVGGS